MTANAAMTMVAQPSNLGDDEDDIESFDQAPASVDDNDAAAELELAPSMDHLANNAVLGYTQDDFPYEAQFHPEDTATGQSLVYDANGGDQFASFDANAPMDFNDNLFGDIPTDFNMNGWVTEQLGEQAVEDWALTLP